LEPTLMADELIREIRRVRHAISRRCNHDVHDVVAYYRQFQDELKSSGKYRFFVKPPHPAQATRERSID
jgi:hypothetical protein